MNSVFNLRTSKANRWNLTYTANILGCPVLLNDILRTPSRHQSRLKANGKRNKLGYKQLSRYFNRLPQFSEPVSITILIYQTKKNPIDIDAVSKTLLDALKHHKIIVDDNHTGIKKLTQSYAKGFHPHKRIKLSIKL